MVRRALCMPILVVVVCAVTAARLALGSEEPEPPYLDITRPLDERVPDLVGRMTLEEKVSQMHDRAAAIPRLGVPAYPWWSEALHGIAFSGPATVFPQAIALAATFDPDLMLEVASAIGDEGRAKFHEAERQGPVGRFHGLTMFSPNINIFRDPRWGRGQETYGEDPYLTARMGVAFVKGLQGDDPRYLKLGTTAKHYAAHSGPEPVRHRFGAISSLRDMRDTYLPAFEALVREGQAVSVMCAYNRVNGDPACASELLLREFLRQKWDFSGYVVSDCGAIHDIHASHKVEPDETHAAVAAIKAGCDLECDDRPAFDRLVEAVRQGLIAESTIDEAVKRLYRVRFRLGLFDPPEQVPYTRIPFSVVASSEHGRLALKAARESIVLLKNESGVLPLPKTLRRVLVLGPNATDSEALRGNYAGEMTRPVTILDGIRAKVGAARVLHAEGVAHTEVAFETVPASALSLKAEYFGNTQLAGEPITARSEAAIDFDLGRSRLPKGIPAEQWSVRWTGTLRVPTNGHYQIGFTGDDGFRVFVDGQLVVEDWKDHGANTLLGAMELEAGKAYEVKVEYYQGAGDAVARLVWDRPGLGQEWQAQALALASKADVVIAVMGISPFFEGEEKGTFAKGFLGGDRTDIGLPEAQAELLKKLHATGKPVILVLLNGSPLAVTWASERLPAIVEAWYPGQEGGHAVADVLFGDANPGGRLPVTFYRGTDDLPAFDDYAMDGRTYRYYRGEPLFPFGYGLSYTRFTYGPVVLAESTIAATEEARVSVEVRNAGPVAGDEVVQLYVTALDPGAARAPIRALAGFKRVRLEAGAKTVVTFALTPAQRRLWDHAGEAVPMTGRVRLCVGGKQPGFKGLADAATTGVSEAELTIASP